MDFSIFLSADAWIALFTLSVLEIVLGIDNIVFISILSSKLPLNQQNKARQLGLGLAMITRIMLLFSLSWVMQLTDPIFNIGDLMSFISGEWKEKLEISGRDLILIGGGLFLIYKSTMEIHHKLEGHVEEEVNVKQFSFSGVIFQILLLDIVFSLDSVITAVGMADDIEIMIIAVIIAVVIMMLSAKTISDFVNEHPTVKILALSFLLLIGVSLLAEGFETAIPKGYIYFAMFFSVLVEMLNLKMSKKSRNTVHLNAPKMPNGETEK